MYNTYIFDFNGTLLDDVKVCHKILNIICKKHNIKEVTLDEYISVFTFPVKDYYRRLGFDVDNEFDIIGKEFHELYDKLSPTEANIFPNVIKVLKTLKDNNKKVVCISASKEDTLINQLKYYGIYDYFDDILGLQDKNANSKMEIATNYINNLADKNILLIGDSIHDFEVATNNKIDCILVTNGHTDLKRLQSLGCNLIDDIIDTLSY